MTEHPFVNELMPSISFDNYWEIILPIVPLIGVMILFAFGYHVVKHLIRGASLGEASIGSDISDAEFDKVVAEVEAENGEYSEADYIEDERRKVYSGYYDDDPDVEWELWDDERGWK